MCLGQRPRQADQAAEILEAAEVLEEDGGFDHGTDVAQDLAPMGEQVQAEDRDAARLRQPQAEDHADQGRLAGTIGPEQAEDFALADLDVDPVEGGAAPIALAEAMADQDRLRAHG